jgi:aryl-alcohol dehydrogenase-like predicted oxidoreductase
MQFHEMIRLEDADRLFAEGGGMEAMQAAQKAGKVRFIGFTGHKDPAVHLRVLAVASDYGFHFDVLQMPLNIMDAHFRSFARQVAPQAMKEGVGIVSMKPLGDSYLLKSKTVTPIEALHFAMNLPTSVVITGIDRIELVGQALEAAKTFKPLTRDEVVALLDRTAQAARRGQFERYKVDNIFDSTAKNPQSLG